MPTFLEKDRIVLAGLKAYRDDVARGRKSIEFARVMDLVQASYCRAAYASAVKRLVVLGLAERRQRTDVPKPPSGHRSRASFEYRITDAGIAKLLEGQGG